MEDRISLAELEEKEKAELEEKDNVALAKREGESEKLAEPNYYAGNGLSPLEAFKKGLMSREETIGFIKGNVIKYTVRAGHKDNASKDIVKAIDYLTHLKELYESEPKRKNTTLTPREKVLKAFGGLNEGDDVLFHNTYRNKKED